MVKQQLFIGAALVAGVAIGYFLAPQTAPTVALETDKTETKAAIADAGENATIAALRARIAELEKKANRPAPRAEFFTNAVARTTEEGERADRPRGDPRQWMEEMKKNDPERYTQMTNRFAQFRERQIARQQARLEFLSSIDTSSMSESAQRTHDELQDIIVKREEVFEQMHNSNLTEEERWSAYEHMRELSQEINRLNNEERQNLIGEAAKSLGLSDADAEALKDTVQDILDVTEANSRGGRGPGGPGGPGGPMGGPSAGAGGAAGGAGGPPM